jgi:hypothetical protein
MAWRPYENLIDGELDNRIAGKVTGWMRFFRNGKQPLRTTFDLAGDFHEDIRGRMIRLRNPNPSDPSETGNYMDGFSEIQRGNVGDITAGISLGPWTDALAQKLMTKNELCWDEAGIHGAVREARRKEFAERYRAHIEAGDQYYPYVGYPYIEWYSDANGRVVLELDPAKVEVIGEPPQDERPPKELLRTETERLRAFHRFLKGMVASLSRANREHGGDGNVGAIAVE